MAFLKTEDTILSCNPGIDHAKNQRLQYALLYILQFAATRRYWYVSFYSARRSEEYCQVPSTRGCLLT